VGVARGKEHAVAYDCGAAVRLPPRCIWASRRIGAALVPSTSASGRNCSAARVAPDFPSATCIDRAHLAGRGHVHHSIGHYRSYLQPFHRKGIYPIQLGRFTFARLIWSSARTGFHMARRYGWATLPVWESTAPIASLGRARLLRARAEIAPPSHSESNQIAPFLSRCLQRGHIRGVLA
jgi:hypothetical protein